MKGLFLCNLYKMIGNIKLLTVFIMAGGIALLVTGSYTFIQIFVCISITILTINAMSSLRKDAETKWNRFEITMPITRAEIIKCKYLFYLFWVFVSTIVAALFTGLAVVIHGNIFFVYGIRDICSLFSLGIGIALLSGAIFYPLAYTFGAEKSEALIIISLVCAAGTAFILLRLINSRVPQNDFEYYISLSIFVIIVTLLFITSYFLSQSLYKKKDI